MSESVSAFYVAYTWGGYQVRFYSAPSFTESSLSASLQSLFRKHQHQLDLPSAVGLRTGLRGFRRDLVWDGAQSMCLYTALVGVSEPGSSRPSSFLAFGAIADQARLEGGHGLGYRLQQMVDQLAQRLTHGGRFRADVDPGAEIIRFAKANADALRKLPEYREQPLPASLHVSDRARHVYLVSTGAMLSSEFDSICSDNTVPDNFFVFERSAFDPQVLHADGFEVTSWPPPPPTPTRLFGNMALGGSDGVVGRQGSGGSRQHPLSGATHASRAVQFEALSDKTDNLQQRCQLLDSLLNDFISSQSYINRRNNRIFVILLIIISSLVVLMAFVGGALKTHMEQHSRGEQLEPSVVPTHPESATGAPSDAAAPLTGDEEGPSSPAPSMGTAEPCEIKIEHPTGVGHWRESIEMKVSLPKDYIDAHPLFVAALEVRDENNRWIKVKKDKSFVPGDRVKVDLQALSKSAGGSQAKTLTCNDIAPPVPKTGGKN